MGESDCFRKTVWCPRISDVDSLLQKITVAHNLAVEKKAEIVGVYDEIFGYSYENEEGEAVDVEGTKSQLENAYKVLAGKVEGVSEDLSDFKDTKKQEYKEFLRNSSSEFSALKADVRKLLPDAMTAGLSYAYEKKRVAEEKVHRKSNWVFALSILLLVLTALMPIALSAYFLLYDSKSVDDTVRDLPKIVFSFLPVYVPLFWFAMAANKRSKLAKRLWFAP